MGWMESKAVAGKFSEFARKHPKLTAKQTRFLGLLQNHIARYGSITVDRLYEQPFTVVDADGIDIARGEWETFPPALARRLARRALVLLGGSRDVSRTHLERFVSFLRQARSGTELELPDDLRLACRREGFRLRRNRVESETSC